MDHAASPKSQPPVPSRTTIPCSDPATGDSLGEVAAMDRAEVLARLQRARTAQAAWAKTSFAQRRRVVRRILDHLLAHTDELCRMISRDSGKTLENAAVEMWPICEMLRWNLAHAESALRSHRASSGVLAHKSARVEYHPLGVIAAICPWNFPLQNAIAPAIPASSTRLVPLCESPATTGGSNCGPLARPSRETNTGPAGKVAANAAA